MDEDSSAKAAPVTRLRKRLSVDAEDSPLPTTPSTPTKKRSTRLAAKPQLELIDEVASENVPKRTTRKTAVKETELEGINTPTPLTPSRRSTRIRSNTSLLSETITQSVGSPRAKRALRRNSQLGSDNESAAPVTPARQIRQTRKDSTTSVDKQAGAPDENIAVLTVTSTETAAKEEAQKDTKANKDKSDSPSTRKSPRFKKKSVKTDETDNIHIETAVHSPRDVNKVVPTTPVQTEQINDKSIDTASPKENETEIEMLSTSSANLINNMKTKDKTTTSLNKSTTSLNKSITDLKNKRKRTKSWTTLTSSPLNVGLVDDKEDSKGKLISRYRTISGSGDGLQNAGNSVSKLEELGINKSINKGKTSLLNTSTDNKENIVLSVEKPVETSKTDSMKLFENLPKHQKPMDLIEDSDSGSFDKLVMDIQIEGDDQCVPVAKPANQMRKDSVEPMDIDETMPENVTIDDFSDKSNASEQANEELMVHGKRKSSISEKSFLNDKSMNKSKRQSSVSQQALETPIRNSINDDKNSSSTKLLDKLDNTQNSSQLANDNNKSRKKSVSFREDNIENMNDSKKNISLSETNLEINRNESVELTLKSSRKSSISIADEKAKNHSMDNSINNQNKDESYKSLNKSTRKSSSTLQDNIESHEVSINNLTKDKYMSQNDCEKGQFDKSLNKSQRKTSTSIVDDNLENLYESCNNVLVFQNQSEIKQNEEATNKSINKSQRKSALSLSMENNSENVHESTNKSKRKSSISQINSVVEENNDNKSSNKSKLTSSQTDTLNLEKSGNENKSTLVISQLKDASTNDTNIVMSPNVTNELSKSVSGPEVKNKGIDKINLSPKNYLTSTPIQQKSLQKIAMQINTSIISPAVEIKNVTSEKTPKLNGTDLKNKKKLSQPQSSSASSDEEIEPRAVSKSVSAIKKSPKKVPALDSSESDEESENHNKMASKKITKTVRALTTSDEESDTDKQRKLPYKQNNESKVVVNKVKTPNKNTPISDSSGSEESEEDVSKNKNIIFDDEASEASDDYESGDSRSDGEKQYEDENEIVEKGETLDSEEDDISNDTDYERDSFIVSSDAEDNEMLSGTGDDLSMSDNELTMSAKSKKKFNERKLKQQKKASREMYEARHMNDSNASSKSETHKSKKPKRPRLESSTLESECDFKQTKKINRLRIDSSQDSVNSADESIGIKKKKSKRLSESVCETTVNEKEISLFNQTTEKNDPLTAAIKLEPKTPQKDFNISTVAINDNIEQVQVDPNASIMKHSETLDPLQATMEVDDEEDSLSENNEIMENYDSVLNNLSLQTKKLKTIDTSLNLNKKAKISKNPVIDQLNLTQTKKSDKNKNKNIKNQHAEPVQSKSIENVVKQDEDSSDSIDMKLLFPEDSNDSEVDAGKFKLEGNNLSEPEEHIIPLKRTEAKTNLLDNTGMNMSLNDSSLNISKKKNKIRKSSGQPNMEEPVILDNGIKIIMDRTGTYEELDLSQASTNYTMKMNKKNRLTNEIAANVDCTDGFTLTQVETSITSAKKLKKNKSFDLSKNNETSFNILSESHSEKKSRKKSLSTSDFIETTENPEKTMIELTSMNTSIKSDKKKKNKDASFIAEPVVEETRSVKKNSKNISVSEENKSQNDIPEPQNVQSEPVSDKKKNKKKNRAIDADESDDAPEEVSYKSEKKPEVTDNVTEDTVTTSTENKDKKNKKKKNKNLPQSDENAEEIIALTNQEGGSRKKLKRKTGGLLNLPAEMDDIPQNNSKKRKYAKDHDSDKKITKFSKQNVFDEFLVPRLPESLVSQLTEKPTETKKQFATAIATVPFTVEEGIRRKNKPSNYLEESVYLNVSPTRKKKHAKHSNPKVLPFTPTALTSDSGCTSRFTINLLPKDIKFVAQASNVENFKEEFLGTQRIKKMGTFERCKIQRSHKLSKF